SGKINAQCPMPYKNPAMPYWPGTSFELLNKEASPMTQKDKQMCADRVLLGAVAQALVIATWEHFLWADKENNNPLNLLNALLCANLITNVTSDAGFSEAALLFLTTEVKVCTTLNMDQRKQRKELSQDIRKKMIISKQLDVPVTTVAYIIQKCKIHGTVANLPGRGRRRKIHENQRDR
ncbi:hypothetical protein NFI96_020981, partial [Prochilodus magdalenae]